MPIRLLKCTTVVSKGIRFVPLAGAKRLAVRLPLTENGSGYTTRKGE